MSTVEAWAQAWGISRAAIDDLSKRLAPTPAEESGKGEAYVQSAIKLEAARHGIMLMRNNVGGLFNESGGFVRFGLMNDSAALNKRIKSSDLIGISKKPITPSDVGKPRGQLVCREIKKSGWQYSGTDRERAQLAFVTLMQTWGADASFASGPGTFV